MTDTQIKERWLAVNEEIAETARAAGRKPEDVRLLVVSKFHPAEAVRVLYDAGQRLFGENYVQEGERKKAALPEDIQWHFIGHPQTNKARRLVGSFTVLQGIDSLRLAQVVQEKAVRLGCLQTVFVQVNLAGETQKSGISPQALSEVAQFLVEAPNVHWQGLMLMPPVFDNPEGARPFFAELRMLRDALEKEWGCQLSELSMGMTGDFRAAIAEGATIVRIGTRILGPRQQT